MALMEFASVGAFASEVLTGIHTIASLRAELWAVERYTTHVADAQKFSVQSQIYSKLASGLVGVLHSSLGHIRHHNVQSLKRRFRIPSHGTSEKTAVHTKVELT